MDDTKQTEGMSRVNVDTTERGLGAEALTWLAAIVASSSDAILSKTLDGTITSWNASAERLFGYAADEIIHQSIRRLIPPERQAEEDTILARLKAGEHIKHYESVRITKDGRRLDVALTISPIMDSAGRIIGASKIIQDISERKHAEQARRESEERLRVFIEYAPAAIAMFDHEMRYLTASRRWREDYGLPEDVAGQSHYALLPEIPERWKAIHLRALAGEVVSADEDSWVRADGSVQWTKWDVRPWYRTDGAVGGILIGSEDITSRKRSAEALRASERRFHAIFDQQFQYSALLSPDERIVEISESVIRGTGIPRAEIAGKRLSDAPWWRDLPDMQSRLERQISEALARSDPSHAEVVYRGRDGSLRYALNTVTALRDERGEVEYLLVEGIDITARKQAEELLQRSEMRYRHLHENLRDAFAQVDMAGNLVDCNELFCQLVGYSRPELQTRTYADLTPNRWHATEAGILEAQVLAHGYSEVYEKEYRRKDGVIVPVELRTILVTDTQGKPESMWAIVRDITERKRAEAVLRRSEQRYRSLVDATSAITWSCPPTGLHTEPQLSWMAFTGQTFEEMRGDGWSRTVHPDDAAVASARWTDAMAYGEPFFSEHRIRRHDGEWRWMSVQAVPIRDARGAIVEWVGMNLDITERKRAELAVRESRQQLSLALAAGQLGFWDWDVPSGRVQFGGHWAAMLGYELSEIEPHVQAWERLVHPEDEESVRATLTAHLEGRTRFYECEHRMRHKDGSWRWILDRGQVVARDAGGRPLRAIGTHADVTARREAENALQEADQRKDEFLAMLAHELRNPLAPVRNAVTILKRVPLADPLLERARDMIERQVLHLTHLVDDLLDATRIARGKILLRIEPCDLAAIALQTVEDYRNVLEAGGLDLTVALPGRPVWVKGDPVRLAQMLSNLLSNAQKFTDPGGRVSVGLRLEKNPLNSLPTQAVLWVRDTGIGIDPAMRPKVFDVFAQADRSLDRSRGGLGLGLALVKGLAELHGGEIDVASRGIGLGAEFRLALPLVQDQAVNQSSRRHAT